MKVGVTLREVAATSMPLHFVAAVIAGSFALAVFLVLMVSRRRSRAAKWALVALFLIGLTSYRPVLDTGIDSVSTLVEVILAAVQGLAIGLLFSPSARAWLRAERDETASAEALERTFE